MNDGSKLVRWTPTESLPERPAEVVDLGWQGRELRVLATVYYATSRDEEGASAVLIFEGTLSFAVFEENMDFIIGAAELPQLAEPYPYGGTWPFVEMLQSSWLQDLADQHCGWKADDLRHFIVSTRNMRLHVACLRTSGPFCHLSLG